MSQQPAAGIYGVIEKVLRASPVPMTCSDLYDRPDIRRLARHVNKVSDTLGNMWRRGYLSRTPAPQEEGSQAKWAYTWSVKPVVRQPAAEAAAAGTPRKRTWAKPHVEMDQQTGATTIELDDIVVVIHPKR